MTEETNKVRRADDDLEGPQWMQRQSEQLLCARKIMRLMTFQRSSILASRFTNRPTDLAAER